MKIRNIARGADWKRLAKRPELTHVDGLVYEASDDIAEVILAEEAEAWEIVDETETEEVPSVTPGPPVINKDDDEEGDDEEGDDEEDEEEEE